MEWAKSHVRAQRWAEEVVLLVEEMRRVIQYLDTKANWWRGESQRRPNVRPDIAQGLAAYGHRQAQLMEDLAKSFASQWRAPLVAADIPLDWPAEYVSHAVAHPAIIRAPRHRKKQTVPLTTAEDFGDDDDSDEERDSSGGEDDVDVSPYR